MEMGTEPERRGHRPGAEGMIFPGEEQSRPVVRWLGGKYRLAPWIISHFPKHKGYLEPYGGGGSVLLQKPRAYNEIYNDLDGEVVNIFRVMRGNQAQDLLRALELTPYARAEYWAAFEPADDPVERARRAIVRSHMGHGTGGNRLDRPTGFRCDGRTCTTNVAGEWAGLPAALEATVARLRGVTIHQLDALELIQRYNDPKFLIYLDPPYVPETRSTKSRKPGEKYHTYVHEMSESDHAELLAVIKRSKAMIAISGYMTALYEEELRGWELHQTDARAHFNSPRIECLWLNQAAVSARGAGPLFEAAACTSINV